MMDALLSWLFKRWLPEPYLSVEIEETELGMSLRFPPGMDVEELIERADVLVRYDWNAPSKPWPRL